MKVIEITGNNPNWDSFVDTTEGATSCHRLGWLRVIEKSFGHRCYYRAVVDPQDRWQAVLPLVHLRSRLFGNFLVSVPFVSYGGLLSANEVATVPLLEEAERIRGSLGAAHVELRHVGRALDGMATKSHKVTMILGLCGDVERQWQSFNRKLRNKIRKAEKSGLKPRTGGLELLDGFYRVFARNMRDLGTPVYPKQFFRNVLEEFAATTRIFAVYHEETMIAAGIASWYGGVMEVPWASSIRDYRGYAPNNMLYWEILQFAIDKGLAKLDFGRSTPNEGTYNFKKQWGAEPIPLYWQYLLPEGGKMPDLTPTNPRYQAAIRAWQKLPVPITNLLGPMIVRNIP
jgi:FemAB-related protein (PEP-CTERM system-associated)